MDKNDRPYVDGFVAAVPERNKESYLELAKQAAVVFKDHGALQVVEAWGDDVPHGKITSFRRAVIAEDDEVVVFAWIIWPSKEARDRGNEAVMKDPRMVMSPEGAPFDAKRLIFGGFELLLQE